MSYKTKSAVLLLVYNRPDLTRQVFKAITAAAPARLYVAADGALPEEMQRLRCAEVKQIVGKPGWACELKALYRNEHLGCKKAVSDAITWFFENEEEGIILEDDCLPSADFFRFCDEMLARYRSDSRIGAILGNNLQQGKKWGDAGYYFSNLTHVWGWASWRRVWQTYDASLARYGEDITAQLSDIFTDPFIIEAWQKIYKQVKAGEIDTWDYQLTFSNFFNNRLSVIPNANLVTNIGFGSRATHTVNAGSRYANLPHQPLGDITHPVTILPQKHADYITLAYDFAIEAKWRKQNKLHRRVKRWFNKMLK